MQLELLGVLVEGPDADDGESQGLNLLQRLPYKVFLFVACFFLHGYMQLLAATTCKTVCADTRVVVCPLTRR